LIHINLHEKGITGYKEGTKVFEGTYYSQVRLVQVGNIIGACEDAGE
jgi:hypothetical protein